MTMTKAVPTICNHLNLYTVTNIKPT